MPTDCFKIVNRNAEVQIPLLMVRTSEDIPQPKAKNTRRIKNPSQWEWTYSLLCANSLCVSKDSPVCPHASCREDPAFSRYCAESWDSSNQSPNNM